MNTKSIIQKLTSRKFFAGVIAVIIPIFTLLNISEPTTQQVTLIVTAVGGLAAYIFGEAWVDSSSNKGDAIVDYDFNMEFDESK